MNKLYRKVVKNAFVQDIVKAAKCKVMNRMSFSLANRLFGLLIALFLKINTAINQELSRDKN
jgi:hypothetical protein